MTDLLHWNEPAARRMVAELQRRAYWAQYAPFGAIGWSWKP